jgi:cell wall-associated NlpC family hydrolase
MQFSLQAISMPCKAVCVVPVADLVGKPYFTQQPHASKDHQPLPLAQKSWSEPARIHQLLFNEIVLIKEIYDHYALIELPQLFYETTTDQTPQTTYWTSLTNLQPFNALIQKGISLNGFPQPLTRNKNNFSTALRATISLTKPFFDTTTHTVYSAGTRFVLDQTPKKQPVGGQQKSITVKLFDRKKQIMVTTTIPKAFCLGYEEKSNEQRIKDFVTVMNVWAHEQSGFIPYVWGGCSIVDFCITDHFSEKKGIFYRPELSSHKTLSGLDCTGLVARAAQLAGIPYFYKNSYTVAKYLKPIMKNESLVSGDLIWIPGHVMVVNSLKNASLIEARHYSHGYGKIHEIQLSQQFQDISTYQDLLTAFFEKKPLKRLDKQKNIVQVIPEFKILKLESVWQL